LVVGFGVLIVDWMIARSQQIEIAQSAAIRKANRLQLQLCKAVWVWQGGESDLAATQTLAILTCVKDTDTFERCTQDRFSRLRESAIRASKRPDFNEALTQAPLLKRALNSLALLIWKG
jgi:hypothetical protein